MLRWILAICLMLVLAPAVQGAGTAATAAEGSACSDADLKSEVPALSAFHEVISPLWHDAWPNKNLALMLELLPQIDRDIATLRTTELPGILRDKKGKWDAGVAECAAHAASLRLALEGKQEQAALDAAESLHSSFEALARTIRPRLPELDAYHQVLYRVYHFDHPNQDWAALAGHAGEMAVQCEALAKAPLPKRFEAKAEQTQARFAALCTATKELHTASTGKDPKTLDAAVERVHTAYRACEQLFE